MLTADRQAAVAASKARYNERNAERLRLERKEKYAANKVTAKAAATEWRHANKEAHKLAVKRYRKANPEVKRAEKAKRRAAIKGVGGSYTKADIKALHEAQGGICIYCPATLVVYEVDHVMPIALGGINDRSNLQLLCPTCNRLKGAQHPAAFVELMNTGDAGMRHAGRGRS